MSGQCEMTTASGKKWHRHRCKRSATILLNGHWYCEQHAKVYLGVTDPQDGISAWEHMRARGLR